MPPGFGSGWTTGIPFLALPLGLRAEQQYRRMTRLPDSVIPERLPALSIIVPARNEERNLQTLLPSLMKLEYPGSLEILVVDDHSTDRTAELAESYGAHVLRLEGGLPAGWSGKPNACYQGAQRAQGEWFLFTDADTLHNPSGPARAVSCAMEKGWDGLSLFFQQKTHNLIDRITLMVAYAGLFSALRPEPDLLNGQFILIHRKPYFESGGHAAVRGELLEDLALGRRLKKLGYTTPILNGEDAGQVRMYSTQRGLFQGMIRLSTDTLRFSGAYAFFSVGLISAIFSPLIVLAGVLSGRIKACWLVGAWSASTLSILPWAKRFGASHWALLAPFGAAYVQVAALIGLGRRLFRLGLSWKGRNV